MTSIDEWSKTSIIDSFEDMMVIGSDEEHKKGHNSLILRALQSNQLSNKHEEEHVGNSNVTWADVVSNRK